MSNEIFDYVLPGMDELNNPEKKPNLLTARLFSMEVGEKKMDNLNENEKAFLKYIQEHKADYDITVNIRDNGQINCNIGSFNSHLVENRFVLWLPFFVISFLTNFYKVLTHQAHGPDLSVTLVGGAIFAIALFGVPSSMFKYYFEKKSFFKWYPVLIAVSIVAGVYVNF